MDNNIDRYTGLSSYVQDPTDPVQFTEALFQVVNEAGSYVPLRNYDYIKSFLRDDNSNIAILKSRQTGFSYGSLVKSLWKGLLQDGYKHIYVSIKKENASQLIEEGLNILKHLQMGYKIALSKESVFELQIKDTKSKIWAISSKVEGGRGFNSDVTLDELAFMPNERKLMNAILQGTVRSRWKTEFISTPFGQTGEFYKIWEAAGWDVDRAWTSKTQERIFDDYYRKFLENVSDDYSYHAVPWFKCPDLDEKRARRLAGSDEVFQQEYGLHFLDESRAVLPYSLLKKNTDYNFKPYSIYNVPITLNARYMGIDPADGGDETAIVISERIGNMWRWIYLYHESVEEEEYVPLIYKLFYAFKIRKIFIDNNNIGRSIANRLERKLGNIVTRVDFTNSSKQAIVYNIKSALNTGSLLIPDDEALHKQLHSLRKQKLPSGVTKFTGKGFGEDDDLIWAGGLSIYETIDNPNLGQFSVETVKIPTYSDSIISDSDFYEGDENKFLFRQAY